MKNKILTIIIAVFVMALVITGCQPIDPTINDPVIPKDPTILIPGYEDLSFDSGKIIKSQRFNSSNELLNFINENQAGSGYNRYYGGAGMMESMPVVNSAIKTTSMKSAPAVDGNLAGSDSIDYSETNIQVKGVDEADIIKTDGKYIYTVSDKVLFIISAGKDAKVISKVKLNYKPSGLFISGNNLAVFGSFYDNTEFKKINFAPRDGMTFLDVYDLTDIKNPKSVKDYKFEGNYFRGRMSDGYMYVLTSTTPSVRPIPMPVVFDGDVRKTIPIENMHYYNIRYNNPIFVNIHAIDIKNPSKLNSESVAVEGSQNLYMSNKNIYITYTEYINEYDLQQEITMKLLEPKLSSSDKQLITKIKKIDSDILGYNEKQSKIFEVYSRHIYGLTPDDQDEFEDKVEAKLKEKLESYKYFEYTIVNKLSFDKGKVKLVANGKVPGHVNNQFSLDENKDVLRIATTINSRWSRFSKDRTESTNNVFTLSSDLKVLDSLMGLAKGERIYSTRFIGDRLYMVTFKQVDPFFVIDLSNAKDIKELGQLKIPGFSRYLHPYDNDTIIGIGHDATDSGRTKGLKISLFDVSNVAKPKEVAKYVSESKYASSTALYEHKAFLFSKDKNLLVIPAYNYDYRDSSSNYNGAMVFSISKDSVKLRGLIDHSMSSSNKYSAAVERSLYIEDLLYTKSLGLLRLNALSDLSKVKNVDLDYKNTGIKVY